MDSEGFSANHRAYSSELTCFPQKSSWGAQVSSCYNFGSCQFCLVPLLSRNSPGNLRKTCRAAVLSLSMAQYCLHVSRMTSSVPELIFGKQWMHWSICYSQQWFRCLVIQGSSIGEVLPCSTEGCDPWSVFRWPLSQSLQRSSGVGRVGAREFRLSSGSRIYL